jgi:hypothetical protein
LPGQQIDEYTIADNGGYSGANFVGHIGPFGLHDWTDRGQRSNGAFAAVPFIEYFEYTQDLRFLNTTGYTFITEIADFYESYMTKEVDNATGTAWTAWPLQLGTFPTGTLSCPEHTIGPTSLGACIVPKELAGEICFQLAGCAAVAYTTDDAWNSRFPNAALLGGAPLQPSSGVQSWVSYAKPESPGYTWNVPKSCSMELCTLASYGNTLQQKNPTMELPLVRRLLNAAIKFSTILDVDARKRAAWKDIIDHLAPLPLTTAKAEIGSELSWVWAETNVTTASVWGANSWYPLDYYSPIHPGEGVGIRSRTVDAVQFEIATRTVAIMNSVGAWRPESGAQMDWIAAVRLGWNATEFVLNAGAALQNGGMYPNLYGIDGGGGLETCGVTLAINEMLLQSHEGGLRFFAVWPRYLPASFTTLRTVGAFLVSASYSAITGVVSAHISSTVGGKCFVFSGDDGNPPAVTTGDGVVVSVHTAGAGRFGFVTAPSGVYSLLMRL